MVSLPSGAWKVIIQMFAGDIPVAISRKWGKVAVDLANGLTDSLSGVLPEIDPDVSLPKRHNFRAESREDNRAPVDGKEGSNLKKIAKEKTRRRMSHDSDRLQYQEAGKEFEVCPLNG